MKKIINDPAHFVDEFLDGILLAHGDQLRAASDDKRAIVRTRTAPGTVGIVTGGGSGHLPLFLGYVGQGLCSGVAVGNVFSSPSAEQILAATTASDSGAGVLYLYGNYGGDVYNFDLAADLAAVHGIRTATVLGADDIASAPRDRAHTRRGVAGIFFAYKIAGAAAQRGDNLDEVTAVAQRAADAVGTMGVGLSPTILPTTAQPSFDLAAGEMEIGVGIHGEPGRRTGPIAEADAIVDEIVPDLLADLQVGEGDSVAVLINGLGATPLEELYVLSRKTHVLLREAGVTVHRTFVGEYATSLEMAGASISLLKLTDELTVLLDAPAESPFFVQNGPDLGGRAATTTTSSVAVDTVQQPAVIGVPSADASTFVARIVSTMRAWPAHADELRDLDAALGDGDLGITVSSGAQAIVAALEGQQFTTLAEPLLRAGRAFATANPSTFAALIGGGLLAAATALADDDALTSDAVARAMRALAGHISARGGAELGDKTVLDALVPTIDVLEAHDGNAADAIALMRETAWQGVAATTNSVSKRGRAAWVGERGAGNPDPGATAYARLLDVLNEGEGL